MSQDGNQAHSFKSMKTYILGDLNLSDADGEDESYEFSSNSSSSLSKNPKNSAKKDAENFLRDDDFSGFIAK